ncbi:MAG TPA: amidohydrolase [Chloroflexota bacterium]|nr:amidohydrolase [Chloroflexota bacterium]
MPRILIQGGYVVTVDGARRVFDPGYVATEGQRIAAVGPSSAAPAPDDFDEVIDARGCIVVPGFINTHQHHWYNLFKGLGRGMLLERWIRELLVPAGAQLGRAEMEVSSRLACLEMLGTGTTTCLNHQVTSTDEALAQAILEPVIESGMRQVFAKEVRPQPLAEQLELAKQVHRTWDGAGQGRVRVALAIESTAHWVALGSSSEELILRGNDLAVQLGACITDHIAGGTMSRDEGYLKFVIETGRTDIEYLHRLGVLDHKWVLAHTIYPRDRDIELIVQSGASVSHTPTSEASRGGGITPVRRMLQAGINVCLGSDGPMVDTSVDMVEQMKAVCLFQNQLHLNPSAVTAEEALEMATIRAAQAIGLDRELGSLEPGKRADLAVFDLQTPRSAVVHHPIVSLVHSGRGPDARWVLCDGEMLVRDFAFVRVDFAQQRELFAEARARALEVIERAGLKRLGAPIWPVGEP